MFRTILALLLLSCSAFGDTILVVSDSGYSLLTQDADGKSVLTPITQVIVLGKPAPIPPSGGSKYRDLLSKVPTSTAEERKSITDALGQIVEICGKSEGFETLAQAKATTGVILRMAIKDRAAWGNFGLEFNKLIAALESSGELKTIADYGKVIGEIAKGIK